MLQVMTRDTPNSHRAATSADTTTARINRIRALQKQSLALWDAKDHAENLAKSTHGKRPFPLIAWRHYSAIGDGEIDRARDEFLMRGVDPNIVEREYRDAKRRYKERRAEASRWDKTTGVDTLSKQAASNLKEQRKLLASFVSDPPRSAAAASSLILFVLKCCDGYEIDECERKVLKATALALSALSLELK